MRKSGGNDNIWSKASGDRGLKQAGNRLGALFEGFDETKEPPSLPRPADTGVQLGRDIILAAQRPDLGALLAQNASLRTQQGLLETKTFQRAPALPRSVSHQSPSFANRAVSSSNRAMPKSERAIFDLAGRFHDFQAGPKIARPNLAEQFIPIVGPAWDAVADLQEGHYGSAAFNAAMAGMDAVPIGFGVKAVRKASKVTRTLRTPLPKAYAVQQKMHTLGLASTLEDVHHMFELNGIARNVQHWKNNPVFLKVLPREVHQRLHHRAGNKPQFGPALRFWHGTTDWMKAWAAGIAGDVTDAAENIEDWVSATKKRPTPQVRR